MSESCPALIDMPTVRRRSRICGLAHPICIVKRQDPFSDSGSKLTRVARWKRCQIRPFLARRVVFFFAEPDVVGPKRNVLYDDVLIALELSVGWHACFTNLQHLNLINPDMGMLVLSLIHISEPTRLGISRMPSS